MTDTTDLDDVELLRRVVEGGMRARAAQEVFYSRHVRYLFAVVVRQCRGWGVDAQETEDLVQDTFQRAFQRASSYKEPDSRASEERRRYTRAWLGKIARNLLVDMLRARKESPTGPSLDELPEDEAQKPPSSRRPPPTRPSEAKNPRLFAIQQALQSLSDREQDILRITALYYRAEGSHQRLPNEVSVELARRWQTTNDNIRAIRSRAMKKLEKQSRLLLEKEGAHDIAQA